MIGLVSQMTGSMNLGVGAMAVIFGIGLVLLLRADRLAKDWREANQ